MARGAWVSVDATGTSRGTEGAAMGAHRASMDSRGAYGGPGGS
ncbi:MAG: hypothetical protein ACFFAS_14515 [Promethearchaeota archaeon]